MAPCMWQTDLYAIQGHKNYLFQRLLGEKLPYSSFRFDFRGNGDSTGTAGFGNIAVKHEIDPAAS